TADMLLKIALAILATLVGRGVLELVHNLSIETLAQRLEASAREELYGSLLGKSQTFHDRQRVGDIMARATDDVRQLNGMMNPGVNIIFNMFVGIGIPLIYIASIRVELLFFPILFLVGYAITLRSYTRQLNPVARRRQQTFGKMN